eukprot:TRINITY_DN38569_c0_g1_i1.p1 TRINITY_DN38569_c0_g1~~TRINITY_DN38569_c0_g1_i1.p1  ORF type:complete len:231 (+),score=38.68 TRINITY_DN38569_c0_g1_i1:77-769(+)
MKPYLIRLRSHVSAFLTLVPLVCCGNKVDLPSETLGASCKFDRLALRPRLFRCEGFASPAWVELLLDEAEAIQRRQGRSCEFNRCRNYARQKDLTPGFQALVEALYRLFPRSVEEDARSGIEEQPLNVLVYEVGGETLGSKGGWHIDPQKQHPKDLLASAILYVGTPEEGGETVFSKSRPNPVVVPPKGGDLAVFISCDEAGEDDEKSLHKGMPVIRGRLRFPCLMSSLC